ncbi:MAG: ATP-binding cassette domain-containing protein, partial [Sphingobacteriales bacterium]
MVYIDKVSFGYRKQQDLFSGLVFEAGPNSIYGLLGKNGAGKSTLLK